MENLHDRGIVSGLHFLGKNAGFDVAFSFIPIPNIPTNLDIYFIGAVNTLVITAFSILFATIIGFTVGASRLSRNWLLAKLATSYVEFFRNIPMLIQVLFWYEGVLTILPHVRRSIDLYNVIFLNVRGLFLPKPIPGPGFMYFLLAIAFGIVLALGLYIYARQVRINYGKHIRILPWVVLSLLVFPLLAYWFSPTIVTWSIPALKGFGFHGGITIFPEFLALLLAGSAYGGAFISEVVRAGLMSIDVGQKEACYALGLRKGLALRLVLFPQAMRVIIPPLISTYLNILKDTSLGVACGYPDIVAIFSGTVLFQTGQAIETIAMTMLFYAFFSLSISIFMNRYNKRVMSKFR